MQIVIRGINGDEYLGGSHFTDELWQQILKENPGCNVQFNTADQYKISHGVKFTRAFTSVADAPNDIVLKKKPLIKVNIQNVLDAWNPLNRRLLDVTRRAIAIDTCAPIQRVRMLGGGSMTPRVRELMQEVLGEDIVARSETSHTDVASGACVAGILYSLGVASWQEVMYSSLQCASRLSCMTG